jgi:hypothetical protein
VSSMARTRSLCVTAVVALAVTVIFAFTLIGLAAEAVALVALIALAARGLTSAVRQARKSASI